MTDIKFKRLGISEKCTRNGELKSHKNKDEKSQRAKKDHENPTVENLNRAKVSQHVQYKGYFT